MGPAIGAAREGGAGDRAGNRDASFLRVAVVPDRAVSGASRGSFESGRDPAAPPDERAAILADSIQHQATSDIEASRIGEAKRRLEAVRARESTTIATELVEDELDVIVARTSQDTRATGCPVRVRLTPEAS